jgi:hypothetical protein
MSFVSGCHNAKDVAIRESVTALTMMAGNRPIAGVVRLRATTRIMLNDEQLAGDWTIGGEIEFALLRLLDRIALVWHDGAKPIGMGLSSQTRSNHCVPPIHKRVDGEIMP